MFTMLNRLNFTTSATTAQNAALARFVGVGMGLLVASGLVGCHRTAPRPSVEVVFGLDISDSARQNIKSGALAAGSVAERLRAGQDGLHLFRLAHECTEFGTGQTIGDAEATLALISAEAAPRRDKKGTLPERFWEQAEREANAAGSGARRRVVIVLATDGDNDDQRPESRQHIAAIAARLAASKRVNGVVVCGVRPSNMTALKAQFAALGARFHAIPAGENNPDATASVIIGCASGGN